MTIGGIHLIPNILHRTNFILFPKQNWAARWRRGQGRKDRVPADPAWKPEGPAELGIEAILLPKLRHHLAAQAWHLYLLQYYSYLSVNKSFTNVLIKLQDINTILTTAIIFLSPSCMPSELRGLQPEQPRRFVRARLVFCCVVYCVFIRFPFVFGSIWWQLWPPWSILGAWYSIHKWLFKK